MWQVAINPTLGWVYSVNVLILTVILYHFVAYSCTMIIVRKDCKDIS